MRSQSAFTQPPFRISEEGWGEFDMSIVLTAIDKGGENTIIHDLNFQSARYEAKHPVVSGQSGLESLNTPLTPHRRSRIPSLASWRH